MATAAYYTWVGKGKPYTLIRPAKKVQAAVKGYGITVYDYPNDAHLKANVPEDHTPFSVTGWPGTNTKYNARGLDVMPRSSSYEHRKENADIARQLIRDRDSGYPGAMWIKYINWTDENGNCFHVRWTDAANPLKHTTRSSTDKGHIHISGRSDVDNDDRADDYDPIARMKGQTMTDGPLSANAERGITAAYTEQDPVFFPFPWDENVKKNGLANPFVKLQKSVDELQVGGVTQDMLAAAFKQALLDPEVLRAIGEITFQSAQRAEKE